MFIEAAASIRDTKIAPSVKPFSSSTVHTPKTSTSKETGSSWLSKKSENGKNSDEETTKIKTKNRNHDSLLYEPDDDKPNEKLDKIIEREKLKRKEESKNSRTVERTSEKFKDFLTDESGPSKRANSTSLSSKHSDLGSIQSKPTNARPSTSKNIEQKTPSTKPLHSYQSQSKSTDSRPSTSNTISSNNTVEPKVDVGKKKTNPLTPSQETPSTSRSPATSSTIRKRPSTSSTLTEPSSIKKNKIEIIYKPLNRLLEGVVLVISGIQVGCLKTIFFFFFILLVMVFFRILIEESLGTRL